MQANALTQNLLLHFTRRDDNMRTYINSLSGVTPSYPSGSIVPREWRDEATDYTPIPAETGSVPAAPYIAQLDYGIFALATLTVTDTTTVEELAPIAFNLAPAAAQVAVDLDNGLLKFHSSRSGHNLSVAYHPLGTPVSGEAFMRLELEVKAVEDDLRDNTPHDQNTDTGTTSNDFAIDSDVANGATGQLTLKGKTTGGATDDYTIKPAVDAADKVEFKHNGAVTQLTAKGTLLTGYSGDKALQYAVSDGGALSGVVTNATTTRKFVTQEGNGTTPAAPALNVIRAADLSSAVSNLGIAYFDDTLLVQGAISPNETTTRKFATQEGDGADPFAPALNIIRAVDLPTHEHAATDITSADLVDARLSDNVPLKDAANVWTGTQDFQQASASVFKIDGAAIGFFATTPASRPTGYTQTYSTASRTHAAYTADAEGTAYTGIDNTQVGTVYAAVADLNALRVAYENLRIAYESTSQVLNQLLDDLQAYGLLQ